MRKVIVLLAVFLLFVLLWWTRYQVIGGDRWPIVVDRFTGKLWYIQYPNAREIQWSKTVLTNEIPHPAKEEAKPAAPRYQFEN